MMMDERAAGKELGHAESAIALSQSTASADDEHRKGGRQLAGATSRGWTGCCSDTAWTNDFLLVNFTR